MNALDWGLIVLFAAGTLLGLFRGFMRILIGILSLIVAFFLASRWQDPLAQILVSRHVSEGPARVAAYLIVFVGTMIAGALVAWIVGRLLKIAMLSWADRLAGAALGLLAAVLGAAFVVHPLVASFKGGRGLMASSTLMPYVVVVADVGNAVAPEAVAKRYESGVETLRRVWRGEAPIDLNKVKETVSDAVDKTGEAVQEATKKR